MIDTLAGLYTSETFLCIFVGLLFVVLGGFLISPFGIKAVARFPRHQLTGYILTAIAWFWVGLELYFRPVDLLAFVSPEATLLIVLAFIPASYVLLENLLPARALGGIFMLWPMPVILAVRSDPSLWSLLPVAIGYVHLIFGMVFVFHPWTVRVLCEKLVDRPRLLQGLGFAYVLVGLLFFLTTLMLHPAGM